MKQKLRLHIILEKNEGSVAVNEATILSSYHLEQNQTSITAVNEQESRDSNSLRSSNESKDAFKT